MLVVEAEHGERLRLGHVLGNYRLVQRLAEGGVATVYEGEHVHLGRRMALKVLHPEAASPEIVARFFNEARAVNNVRHPNIVDVEDFITAPTGEHYLILELLAGEDLRSVISRDGVLAPARVAEIGERIASALAAVHRVGIIHRDLKPDNIYLCRTAGKEVPKLLDFGIAKFLTGQEGMTREGMTLGTPEYMAPEQILAKGSPGPRADLYALGMVMYECLAGAPAFTATMTASILHAHISEPVVPPSHRRGEAIPPVLEAAVLKCLEKDPAHRFASGDELAAALRADRPVELFTPRHDPRERSGRRSGRVLQMLPAVAMAAAALVLHLLPRPGTSTAAANTIVGLERPPRPAVVSRAAEPEAPGEATPTDFAIALTSNPDGAELFLGDQPIGTAPHVLTLPFSNAPVSLVARFDDGTEVVQTIVPNRPLPQIAFARPRPAPAVVEPPPEPRLVPAKRKPVGKTKLQPVITDRDGTLDPFQ
jgi:eukaryotic-like serine/threonine-protein kinase